MLQYKWCPSDGVDVGDMNCYAILDLVLFYIYLGRTWISLSQQ